jgi:nicotinamidase-related amidase
MQYHDAHPAFGVGLTIAENAPALADFYFTRLESTVVPTISRLLQFFRRTNRPVIHLTLGSDLASGADLPRTLRERNAQRIATKGRPSIYSRFDREFGFLPGMEPLPRELVLNKTTHSGFASTPLAQKLRNMEVDAVVITGVVTSVCIESTARDAVDQGFRAVIVDDGCASWDQESHEATLRAFSRHFGMVSTADNILHELTTQEVK